MAQTTHDAVKHTQRVCGGGGGETCCSLLPWERLGGVVSRYIFSLSSHCYSQCPCYVFVERFELPRVSAVWVAIRLIALQTHRVVIYHPMTLLMSFKLINCNPLKTRQLIRRGRRTVKKHMSLWNEQKMDSGAANHCATLSLGAQIKPSCKQKKEAAFCDRLAVTSCLWLYVQKQNQGLWTSHDSVSPGRPTVSGSLHAV